MSYWDRWYQGWLLRHAGKSRFIQNGYPKKSRDPRSDWREHKQFARDQAKGSRRSGCPKWLKRQCNKDYRRWSKDLIKNGRDEEVCWRKDFYDPWMWS